MDNHLRLEKPVHMTLTEGCVKALKTAIRNGTFPRGSQLPTEMDLIGQLGVSRTTLREALRNLEEDGLILRRRGLGTFVNASPILKDISINFGITEMILQAGLTPQEGETIISIEKANESIAEVLGINQEDPIVVFDRIRVVKDHPVVWSIDKVPSVLISDYDLREYEKKEESIYDFFLNGLNIHITRGVAHLYPIAATKVVAEKLKVPKGSPLLRITQTDYDSRDRPVIFSIEYHIPDAFDFVVNRKGPHY
jgi:GntR family transcriptional regulator